MAELKPCPFCGDNQQINYVELSNGLHYIDCGKCGASPSRLGAFDYETAIRYWNGEAMPNTNGNRLRKMTDEELAKMFARVGERCRKRSHCQNCPLNNGCNYDGIYTPFEIWLKQEANEDAEHS